jgi:hypothetical protein
MTLLAHGAEGHGWGGPFQPWEFHPALNHLPIAFLLAAVALELYPVFRDRLALLPTGTEKGDGNHFAVNDSRSPVPFFSRRVNLPKSNSLALKQLS